MTLFSTYLTEIEQSLRAGDATEHTHRPALKTLLEALDPEATAVNEPKQSVCGAPDYVLRKGQAPIGFVEAKDVGKSLDEAEKGEQLRRYRTGLTNLVLTDYLEFRWYVDGEPRLMARLATVGADGKLNRVKEGASAVHALLLAFLQHPGEVVATPQDLATRLARLTHLIRDVIIETFGNKVASSMLSDLRSAFADTLIPELAQPEKAADFADMFSQTLAYGLFAARCNHEGKGETFVRLGAAAEIPKTNPFLRKLFDTITGTELNEEPYAGLVDDLVGLLARADLRSILEHFGRRGPGEDPIIHFYETFLAAYDPKLREARGVYYTPEPVVSYIVRSIDYLLKTRFDCPDGLADTSTIEYETEGPDGKPVMKKAPKVLLLDPACGTGTFLYGVVDYIREEFAQRKNAGVWSQYVKKQLLPRLFGFELLMAPYAVAHLKLGMQLAALDLEEEKRANWKYDFGTGERLGVYLTNTLEEAERHILTLFGPWRVLTEEAEAAASIKKELPIMVVFGNPPYSGHSVNRSWEIKDGKRVPTFIGKLVRDYYFVDGEPLNEKNPKWLQDDYVKFIRWGQWKIEQSGGGILAFITNNGYLDNPTFRGMRRNLMRAFNDIFILNLHGNSKKQEQTPQGGKDENVFNIQQGVAIAIFIRDKKWENDGVAARVHHLDVWGRREEKYAQLVDTLRDAGSTNFSMLEPVSPNYLFFPLGGPLDDEYKNYSEISCAFLTNVLGFQSHRDSLAIAMESSEIHQRVDEAKSRTICDENFIERYGIKESKNWSLKEARTKIRTLENINEHIAKIEYRPFDFRYCFLHSAFIDRPRKDILSHVFSKKNLCLNTVRQTKSLSWQHAVVSDLPTPAVFVEVKDGSTVFPLYLYPNTEDLIENGIPNGTPGNRRPNLSPEFITNFSSKVGLGWKKDGKGNLEDSFGPEDIFHYMYAVFHSPTYRVRYAEFLKIDFPRLPLTSNVDLFRTLVPLGERLVKLHLAEAFGPDLPSYPIRGSNVVEKPRFVLPASPDLLPEEGEPRGRVYINKTQYFDGVPPDVWEFHIGGYQVCEKWLKDRKGRELNYDDLVHYSRIVAALGETIRLMEEIDEAIPGWPIE